MFKLLLDMLFISNVGAQMALRKLEYDHGCVQDGGYTWCGKHKCVFVLVKPNVIH